MISAIRNRLGSWVVNIFVGFAIVAFILSSGIFINFRGGRSANWAFMVNKEEITNRAYHNQLEIKKEEGRYLKKLGRANPDEGKNTQLLAANALIDKTLARQEADSLGILVSEEQAQAYATMYGAGSVTPEGIAFMQGELQREQFSRLMGSVLHIPHFILENEYRVDYSYKKYSILRFSYEAALKEVKSVAASEKDLQSFYTKENKEHKRYWTQEKRSGTVWKFAPKEFGIDISDKQIESYYKRMKKTRFIEKRAQVTVRRILLAVDKEKDTEGKALPAAHKKAQELHQQLVENPDKFADLAKKHSMDKDSAEKGGLLEPLNEFGSSYDGALVAAAFKLESDGEISPVMETKEGVEILQRVSKEPTQYKKLEAVRDEIVAELREERFKKMFSMSARQVATKGDAALTRFVKSKHGAKSELSANTRPEPDDFSAEGRDEIRKKLFSLKKAGTVGYGFTAGEGYLVRLDKLEPAQQKAFASVKDTVEHDYYHEQAKQVLKKQADRAIELIEKGNKPKGVAKEFGVAYQQTPLIARDMFHKVAGLRDKGVPVDKMWQLRYVGAITVAFHDNKDKEKKPEYDGFILRLDEMQRAAKGEFKERFGSLYRSAQNEIKPAFQASFIANLRDHATIEVNENVVGRSLAGLLQK